MHYSRLLIFIALLGLGACATTDHCTPEEMDAIRQEDARLVVDPRPTYAYNKAVDALIRRAEIFNATCF